MFLSQNNNNDGDKEQEETLGGAGYVDVIECDNCFMNVYLSLNSPSCTD